MKKLIITGALVAAAGISLAACGSSGSNGSNSSGPALPSAQVCPQQSAAFDGIKCGYLNDPAYLTTLIRTIVAHPEWAVPNQKGTASQFDPMFSANGAGTADVVQLFGADQAPSIITALRRYNDGETS